MPAFLDDFESLKRRVADARRQADQAAGEEQAALRRLKDDHGCADDKAATALLSRLEADERRLAADATAARDEFEKEFNSLPR